MPTRIVGDRLYGLTIRPQELAFYGAAVRCALRTALMAEDAAVAAERHHRLVVLEVEALVPEEDALHAESPVIQVLKVGWELELAVDPPQPAAALAEDPAEVRHALERIAASVNRLSQEAGQGEVLGPDLRDRILMEYRIRGSVDRE
ncbi:MAG: hypothetical protein RLZZ127_3111 [Planctomycetota bacterium]|jgi:hypothetical protein